MSFQKGHSGNPRGRPREVIEVRKLARTFTELAIETLADICRNSEKEQARVAAAVALLDRAYGKPAQEIQVAPPPAAVPDLAALTSEERAQLEALIAKAADADARRLAQLAVVDAAPDVITPPPALPARFATIGLSSQSQTEEKSAVALDSDPSGDK